MGRSAEQTLRENELIGRAAGGDGDALGELVPLFRGLVYSVAYKVALNEEDALDITQNVFLRLVTRISQYAGRGSFAGWLAAMTTNEAISHLRSPGRRESPSDQEALGILLDRRALESDDWDPAGRLDREDRLRRVHAAMSALSPQQRAILVLTLTRDMKPREISRELGIPNKQVSGQISRAVGRLRELLNPPARETQLTGNRR